MDEASEANGADEASKESGGMGEDEASLDPFPPAAPTSPQAGTAQRHRTNIALNHLRLMMAACVMGLYGLVFELIQEGDDALQFFLVGKGDADFSLTLW